MTTPADTLAAPLPFYLWDTLPAPAPAEPLYVGLDMIDSIFAPRAAVAPPPSLFEGHTLVPAHTGLLLRPDVAPPAWTFVLLLLVVAGLLVYCYNHQLRFRELLPALFSRRNLDRLLSDRNLGHLYQLLPIALLCTATLALPLHRMLLPSTGLLGALVVWAGLGVVYLLRNALTRLLGLVFDVSDAIGVYLANGYLFHLVLTILLLPAALLYFYAPFAPPFGIALLAALLLVGWLGRIVRGISLFFAHPVGQHFHLFYYLCTVELIPILVIIKQIIA